MDLEVNSELRKMAIAALSDQFCLSSNYIDERLPTYLRMAAWDAFVFGKFDDTIQQATIQQADCWFHEHGAI